MKIILASLLLLMIGCTTSNNNSSSDEISDTANSYCTLYQCPSGKPEIVSYPEKEMIFKEGDTVPNMVPTIKANSDNIYFRVIPQLPTGMFFNKENGEISGFALSESPLREYRVILDNRIYNLTTGEYIAGGYAIYPISIQINKIKPESLSYHNKIFIDYYKQVLGTTYEVDFPETISFISLEKNQSFIPLSPYSTGGSVTNYSISPSLPNGIYFNSSNGEISGRPLVDQQNTVYTIKAENNGGEVTFLLSLEIKGIAPFDLRYYSNDNTYKSGEKVDYNFPIYSGDTATNYSVLPSLPSGLYINSFTGEISGYPKEIIERTEYKVRASNNWGYTEASIFIEVKENISKISTGKNHSCAIKNKEVYCWGSNQVSQLGYSTDNSNLCFNENNVLNSCYKKGKGLLLNNNPLEAIDLVSSENTNCILSEEKKVLCWGLNDNGQLGRNVLDNNLIEKDFVIKDDETILDNIKHIGAGVNHFCALQDSGDVYCWGDNSSHQIKNVSNESYNKAIKIEEGVSSLSVGYNHNCIIKSGKGYCWGDNLYNNLGYNNLALSSDIDSTILNTNQDELINIQKIHAGYYSTYITVNNEVLSFGLNNMNQIDNTLVNKIYASSTDINDFFGISLGLESQCLIDDSDFVSCWGVNNYNFGNGSLDDSLIKTYVVNSGQEKYVAEKISSGYSDFRCISQSDSVFCFGKNYLGQLGDNTVNNSLNPKSVIFE